MDAATAGSEAPAKGVSGKLVVIGMFAFGMLLTAALYGYWELHTRPFRPLQEAIARTIPGSSPRVVGGRHKSHQAAAKNTLRIIVQVGYNPTEAKHESERDELARSILQLARAHHDVTPYELIELHLEHRLTERPSEVWSSIRTPAEWDVFAPPQTGLTGSPSP